MSTTMRLVETYGYEGTDLRMDVPTVLGFARQQRHFGPSRLLVLAATRTARITSISYTDLDDCPDCVLRTCLQIIKNEEPALITAIGDISSGWLDACPLCRFEAAYDQVADFGAQLFDWIDCDETTIRSLRLLSGGRYTDLPKLIRPSRWTYAAVTPTEIAMPDELGWDAPATRLT